MITSKVSSQSVDAVLSSSKREQMFEVIYKNTHADFKGMYPNGDKTLLSWAKFGFGLSCLKSITDVELIERYMAIKSHKR